MNMEIFECGKILWDYLKLNQKLEKVDSLLVFGGHDPSVAIHAASLYKSGYSDHIIVSGANIHPAKFYGNEKDMIESEAIREVLIRERVPAEAIILERNARNTSENFWYTADLIKGRNLGFNTFILVQKPYTERRTYLTGLNRWKDKKIFISSIDITYEEYMNCGIEQDKIINMMTGEIYRLDNYPRLGYFDRVEIPIKVREAFNVLVKMGYNKRFDRQII